MAGRLKGLRCSRPDANIRQDDSKAIRGVSYSDSSESELAKTPTCQSRYSASSLSLSLGNYSSIQCPHSHLCHEHSGFGPSRKFQGRCRSSSFHSNVGGFIFFRVHSELLPNNTSVSSIARVVGNLVSCVTQVLPVPDRRRKASLEVSDWRAFRFA